MLEQNLKALEQKVDENKQRCNFDLINITKLFIAVREHNTGNPPKNKIDKIRKLLPQNLS